MKKYLTSALLILTAATVLAEPPRFVAPTKPKRSMKAATKKRPPPPVQQQQVRGVLARAFAPGNNPLQMLNPKAPPSRYGTSRQHVSVDPDTGKVNGIKLVEIVF